MEKINATRRKIFLENLSLESHHRLPPPPYNTIKRSMSATVEERGGEPGGHPAFILEF